MNATILNDAIRLLSHEMTKRGHKPFDNDLITAQLERVETHLSKDHRNELITMFHLDTPNVDGACWERI